MLHKIDLSLLPSSMNEWLRIADLFAGTTMFTSRWERNPQQLRQRLRQRLPSMIWSEQNFCSWAPSRLWHSCEHLLDESLRGSSNHMYIRRHHQH